jgi:hypothetical protein
VRIRGALDLLRQAEGIARAAADAIEGAKRDAVAAINRAISEFFAVSEHLTVSDRMPWYFSGRAGGSIRTLRSAGATSRRMRSRRD